MSKRHSLAEHVQNVRDWWFATLQPFPTYYGMSPADQTIFFIGYERWLNDRPLLTDEDEEAESPT